MEALELKAALAGGMDRLAHRFFAGASKVIDVPWSMAVGNDLRIPEAIGPRTLAVRALNAYISRLHKAAHHDHAVTLAYHRVRNLLDPPAAVMCPRIAARVAWSALRRAVGRQRSARELERHIPQAAS
jgi:hypothetical protein